MMTNLQSSAFVARTTQLLSSVARLRLLLVMFLTLTVSANAWGAEYSYTFSAKQFSANGSKTLNGVSWTLAGNGNYWGYDGTKGQQFGSGSAPYKTLTLSTSGISGTITKIIINTSGASSVNASFTVSVGGTQWGSSTKLTTTATAYTFTGSNSGEIKFSYTQTSSKALYIKSISVTYETAAATVPVTGVSLNKSTLTLTEGDSETLTATITPANATDKTVTWSTSDANIATVSNGKVTAVAEGSATITVKTKDGNKTATCSVTVNPKPKYTVTLSAGPGSCAESVTEASAGEGVTLPEPTLNNCDDWTFAGWATSAVATETATAPETLLGADEMYYPSDHCTLYAVYQRTETTEGGETTTNTTDKLTRETTDVDDGSTTYSSWSGKTVTSSAVYAGNSAGSNNSIQLRSNNSNSGVITTKSGGKAKKVTVVWQSSTSNGRTLDIYGKNSAYSAATDLYSTSTQGTKLGSIVKGTSTTLTITGDYEYIGLRSNSGAMYLSSISIDWATTTSGGSTTYYHSTPDCATQMAPSLIVSESSLPFGNVTVYQSSQKTFTLSGSNLTANASLQLSGINSGMFSLSSNSVTQSAGSINQTITVTYTPTATGNHNATLTISSTGAESKTVTLSGTGVAQMANYTVKHYKQNLDGTYPTEPTETEYSSGEVGTNVTPAVKSYEGFTAPTEEKSVEITADGNAVVEYQYARNSYTLTWNVNGGNALTGEYTSGSVKYGAAITQPDEPTRENHNFKGWKDQNGSTVVASTMPADDLTYTAQWKATYTVTFLNHGEEVEQVTVEAGNSVTLPTEELISCDTEKYPYFYGWTETPIAGVGTEKPTDLITADFTPERSMTLHAVFVDQLPQAGGWQVVSSVSELVAGKIYTIGSYGSPTTGTAMGTQNTNNRGTTSWTTGTPVELTLGGSTGEWTLYDPVEEGYLCAASSSSNHLKTQSPLTDNGKWDITFSSKKAKIVAQGNYTRNIIRYNSTSSIFSCYSSGQNDIQLLTKSMATEPSAYITSCCETPAPTNGNAEVLSGTSVKLTWEGSASRYHITGGNLSAGGVYTNATSDTILGLTACETYTFNISAAPQDACESAAISVTATPFEAKTITFVDGSTTTTLSTTCEKDEIEVPTLTAQNCSTYVWKDEQGNEYDAGDKITPTTNMTLTTVWTVIQYTVTFVDYDDTTVLKESEVNCGEMPTPPADPTRPESNTHKYTFAGWTPSIKEADDHQTYTATYTETQHQITVIWMVNGEEYTEGEPSNMVLAGEKVAKLPTPPSPDDYCGQVFAGWTDQPIDSAPIENAPAVLFNTPEASPTLYKEEDKTTVTFYAVFADIKE